MNNDQKILKEAQERYKKSIPVRTEDLNIDLKPGESSLHKLITTQKQADRFMAMLRALDSQNAAS